MTTLPDPLVRVIGVAHGSHFHQAPGRHPVPHRIQPGHEIIEVLTSGRGWVQDGKDWREVGPGDLLWHVADDHTIGRSDFQDPYRCLAVNVQVRPGLPRPVERFTRWEDLGDLRAYTRQVVAWLANGRLDRRALGMAIYGRCLTEAQAFLIAAPDAGMPEPLLRLRRLIEQDVSQDLTVERMADLAGWSAQHLHARFKEHFGLTPHQYVLDRRLQVAREMLAGGDEPLERVARRTGFSSPAVFCRAFRQVMGRSPGQWRRLRG